jgi:hypothetical protein
VVFEVFETCKIEDLQVFKKLELKVTFGVEGHGLKGCSCYNGCKCCRVVIVVRFSSCHCFRVVELRHHESSTFLEMFRKGMTVGVASS